MSQFSSLLATPKRLQHIQGEGGDTVWIKSGLSVNTAKGNTEQPEFRMIKINNLTAIFVHLHICCLLSQTDRYWLTSRCYILLICNEMCNCKETSKITLKFQISSDSPVECVLYASMQVSVPHTFIQIFKFTFYFSGKWQVVVFMIKHFLMVHFKLVLVGIWNSTELQKKYFKIIYY